MTTMKNPLHYVPKFSTNPNFFQYILRRADHSAVSGNSAFQLAAKYGHVLHEFETKRNTFRKAN